MEDLILFNFIAFIIGILAGFIFFGSLWIAVNYYKKKSKAQYFLVISMILRFAFIFIILYLAYRLYPPFSIIFTVLGFSVLRLIMVKHIKNNDKAGGVYE